MAELKMPVFNILTGKPEPEKTEEPKKDQSKEDNGKPSKKVGEWD